MTDNNTIPVTKENIKSRRYILFDLDGTLSESASGIVASVAHALDKMGVKYRDYAELERFVGPPLKDEFMEFCNVDSNGGDKAVEYYREYYTVKGIYENAPYNGIKEALAALAEAGKVLAVATSKPEVFAKKILDSYGFTSNFACIGGAGLDESRIHKDEVINYVLHDKLCVTPDECVMVGDREHDVYGAAKFGIPSIGVLWGYGSKAELLSAGAVAVMETPEKMVDFLLH